MKNILRPKQELVFRDTKPLNQYPIIKAQTSDKIQPLENYKNSTVAFDNLLLWKQESIFDLFFTRRRHNKIDFYYISQGYFHLPKNTIFFTSIIIFLFKQSIRDIILSFHDISVLDMNLEEWKQLFRKTWENDYDYLRINRFAKIGEGRYTIRNCKKSTYIECTPEAKPF